MKYLILIGLLFSFKVNFSQVSQKEFSVGGYATIKNCDTAQIELTDDSGIKKHWFMIGPYIGAKLNYVKTVIVFLNKCWDCDNNYFIVDDKKYYLKKEIKF